MPNVVSTLFASERLRTAAVRLTPRTIHVLNRKGSNQSAHTDHAMSTALAMMHPTIAVNSPAIVNTHPQTRRPKLSKKLAKDTLLLSLEALAQSADAFPPLKSVVGGLLFIVTQIDVRPLAYLPIR